MNTSDARKNIEDSQNIFAVDADYIRIFYPALLSERDKQLQDLQESTEMRSQP